jgi:hypothetical protein
MAGGLNTPKIFAVPMARPPATMLVTNVPIVPAKNAADAPRAPNIVDAIAVNTAMFIL